MLTVKFPRTRKQYRTLNGMDFTAACSWFHESFPVTITSAATRTVEITFLCLIDFRRDRTKTCILVLDTFHLQQLVGVAKAEILTKMMNRIAYF